MSRLLTIERAWTDRIDTVAALSETRTGTVATATTLSVSFPVGTWDVTTDHYRYAVCEFTSGALKDEWRVVTAYGVDGGTATLSWHDALPSAPLAAVTFSVSFAPVYGATIFRRGVVPSTIRESELPMIFAASERQRAIEQQAIGRGPGARKARYTLRTDVLSLWDDTETAEVEAHKLYAQLDAMRGQPFGIPGVAYAEVPTSADDVAGYGELDRGTRVYWSTLRQSWTFST